MWHVQNFLLASCLFNTTVEWYSNYCFTQLKETFSQYYTILIAIMYSSFFCLKGLVQYFVSRWRQCFIFTQLFRWLWPPVPGALSDLQPSLTYQTPQGRRNRDCSHRWHVDLDSGVGAPHPRGAHPRPGPWGVVGEAGLGAERMTSWWGRCWGWRLTAEK